MIKLITSIEELPPILEASLSPEERAFISSGPGLPFAASAQFAALAGPEKDDPLRQQIIPDPREGARDPFELEDPLGEALYRRAPRLIHQYQDRCLLLAGGGCAGYCRHCFRRVRMSAANSFISGAELVPVLAYLREHPEIREILVSGGDPLTADDWALGELFSKLRETGPGRTLRVCTRIPITAPERISPGLIELFSQYRPLRISAHINHRRELSPGSRQVFKALTRAGIPVLVQTVLLKGVNSRAEVLKDLFQDCLSLNLRPYYLFQLDLAPGTAHFRLSLKQGLALYQELKTLWGPEPGLPPYALDLPGGGGKIRLSNADLAVTEDRAQGRVYLLRDSRGKLWPYPADEA